MGFCTLRHAITESIRYDAIMMVLLYLYLFIFEQKPLWDVQVHCLGLLDICLLMF